jgi:hypothetical protein
MIGPNFVHELEAAGLMGKPISWTTTGDVKKGDLTEEEDAALASVIAAHDPTKAPLSWIKAEAGRRIIEIAEEWKQRNLIAQATLLLAKGPANWSEDDIAAWTAGELIWTQIAQIRAKSDELEAQGCTLDELADDATWAA